VVKEFGEGNGTILLDQIGELAAEMRMIVVDWKQHSLASAADFVREEISKRYPRLTTEALEALAWKWSFENR
jgi:hypothetical protein